MNKPSDPDPFQRLTNRLRESTFSTLAGGSRAQSFTGESSDGEHPSKIVGKMVTLNNEAHLSRHAINRTSCELRMASTNLRKSIMERKQTRLCHGLFGYAFNL
jgi:hypothetical protein